MNRTLARLDSIHEEIRGAVSSLEPDIYVRRPATGEWSVAEIVHHLCLVEARVIKELEGAVARPPRRVSSLRRLIPTAIVSVRLVRVKAPKAMNPLDPPEKEAAIANFDRIRESLKAFCDAHGKARLRNVIFKHPFLGETRWRGCGFVSRLPRAASHQTDSRSLAETKLAATRQNHLRQRVVFLRHPLTEVVLTFAEAKLVANLRG